MRDVLLVPSNRLDILCLGEVFDMYYTDWNNIEGVWPTTPGTPGAAESLGGTFASPPAAVAVGSDNLEVFGLGLDYAVYHKSYDAAKLVNGSHWSPAWERLGGNFTFTRLLYRTRIPESIYLDWTLITRWCTGREMAPRGPTGKHSADASPARL